MFSLVLNIAWSYYSQTIQAEKEMQEKSAILAAQLAAVWEFMDINQDLINYDSEGNYEFKGLHCSLVGKSISAIFNRDTNYVIQYTNFSPRRVSDAPDEFEEEALYAFLADNELEYYATMTEVDGERVYRYVEPLYITESCLECHGEPAGELDVLGFEKEGWVIGDLGGAISITMPIEIYLDGVTNNVIYQVIFFFVVILLCVSVIYFGIAKLVTRPLNKLGGALEEIESGNLNISVDELNTEGEIKELASKFNSMASQLKDLYGDLENKIEIRTEQLAHANNILESQKHLLEEANDQLKEESQYKSDFLAIMSHELRTPLTSILAFTEIWEKENKTKEISASDCSIVEEIKFNGKILLNMINNTLDMAKLEAGHLESNFEPLDLIDLLNTVEVVVKSLAISKNIEFETSISLDVPLIYGDWDMIRRIIENLSSNAIKFTDAGGKVTIDVRYNEVTRQVIICVKDTGIGMEKAELEHIFEKFVQVDSSVSRKYNGTGLGLALAKELTEMHGGTISATSIVGKGSVFVVVLPVMEDEWEDFE